MKRFQLRASILLFVLFAGCSGELVQNDLGDETTQSSSNVPGANEPAARVIFRKDNFTDITDFVVPVYTSNTCLGDMVRTYQADAADYLGIPQAFPSTGTGDVLLPTTRPAFLKHVSVDVTNTYYPLTQTSVMPTDACSYRLVTGAPEPSSCADFDETPPAAPSPTVAPTATPNPTPDPVVLPTTTQYYGTGYYRVRDDWCTNQGVNRSADVETSKAYVGGVNIDIDRSQLGAKEDLLMLVTYQSLNSNASWPGPQLVNDRTVLKVSLVATQASLDTLLTLRQPRIWSDHDSSSSPVIIKEIASLEDPLGSLQTEQVYIPISQNALIDRIRLDRVRGSFHLYQIDIYRLGNRSN